MARRDQPHPNVKNVDQADERQQSDENQCQAEVNENGLSNAVAAKPSVKLLS